MWYNSLVENYDFRGLIRLATGEPLYPALKVVNAFHEGDKLVNVMGGGESDKQSVPKLK